MNIEYLQEEKRTSRSHLQLSDHVVQTFSNSLAIKWRKSQSLSLYENDANSDSNHLNADVVKTVNIYSPKLLRKTKIKDSSNDKYIFQASFIERDAEHFLHYFHAKAVKTRKGDCYFFDLQSWAAGGNIDF